MVNTTTLCPMHMAKMALEKLSNKTVAAVVDHAAMGHDMSGMDHSGMGGMLHDGMMVSYALKGVQDM